jgi:hypothetical protein
VEILFDSEILRHELPGLFRNTIGYASKINAQYEYFMNRDGKILGQERVKLLESLDNLFINLVMLRVRLESLHQTAGDSRSSNRSSSVHIENRHNKVVISGRIVQEDLFGIKNFNSGYETLILDKIKTLLILYKNSIQGDTIQEHGFEKMYSMIDEIFYNIVAVRYNLENCLIDR